MEKYIKVETYLTLDFKHQIIQHVSKTSWETTIQQEIAIFHFFLNQIIDDN